jgi:hypothetical protein
MVWICKGAMRAIASGAANPKGMVLQGIREHFHAF